MSPVLHVHHVRIFATRLLVVLIGLIIDDVEEAELVDALGGRYDAQPVTQLLLLEELLGAIAHCQHIALEFRSHSRMRLCANVQVLQVSARELLVRNDLDLSIALLRDLDRVAKVAGAALDLDAVVQELLEGLDVEDLVVDGLRAVDDELLGDLLALGRLGGLLLQETL